jgi:hypothetical protein
MSICDCNVTHTFELNFVPFPFRTVLETLFFRRILGSVTVERVIMDMSQVLVQVWKKLTAPL